MRRPLIAGNWKMNKLPSEATGWLEELLASLGGAAGEAQLLLNVPATHLAPMSRLKSDGPVELGAQDLSAHDQGAYTGEVSGAMLRDAGARYVIVGHSERRAYHHEDDELVAAKLRAAQRNELVPILCVGETERERDAGEAEGVVLRQMEGALAGLELIDANQLVVAYEPVWAIGTGRTATAADAQQMSRTVRGALERLYPQLASGIRVLYGGSMKPANAAELLAQEDIDGGLIGGASLEVDDLLAIYQAAS
ncbi:MAG TPA: triose-phosphate isomerase [Trueperaceae bacterium]